MQDVHLEFPREDGMLLTKKGLMKVVYLKELVVLRPLSKSQENSSILRTFLKNKLMKELRESFLHRQTVPKSRSSSETVDRTSTETSSDQASSDQQSPSTKNPKPCNSGSSQDSTSPPDSSAAPPPFEWRMTPLLNQWTDIVLNMMSKDPEMVGRKMGKLDIPMEAAILLGNHPLLHRTVLHRMVRFMRAAYQDHKSEDILVIHREQRSTPTSTKDSERYTLRPADVLLLLPTTLSQSAAHLRFELGTHFCRVCRTTQTINPTDKEPKCSCGNEMEVLKALGTMHSHGSMRAFSSGTDNKHEIPHIGFHMTVGDLDKQQESLVLSFCDGEVRIPLNLSDLFAIEKPDGKFDGQIDRWVLERRNQKKKRDSYWKNRGKDEGKKTGGNGQSPGAQNLRPDVAKAVSGSTQDPVQPVLFDDDTIAMTRIENQRDTAGIRRFEGTHEDGPSQAYSDITELIDRVLTGHVDWINAASMISRFAWSLSDEEVDDLYDTLAKCLQGVTEGDTKHPDHPVLVELLEHVRYVADKRWERV